MSDTILGLKLIHHNISGVNLPDDPSFPFKLEVNLRPPELMNVVFVLMPGGSEEIVVRSMTKESLDKFVEMNNLRVCSRLHRLTITGPDGIMEQTPKE